MLKWFALLAVGKLAVAKVPCGVGNSATSLASDFPRTRQPADTTTYPGQGCGFAFRSPLSCLTPAGPNVPVCIETAFTDTSNMELALPPQCREPPPANAPDLVGLWQAFRTPAVPLSSTFNNSMGAIFTGFFQSIQQCGYRFVIAGVGARHDGWCSGNTAGMMADYANPYFPGNACGASFVVFEYMPSQAPDPNNAPLYAAAKGDMHAVRVLQPDGSLNGYAHRFRVDCPANIAIGNFPPQLGLIKGQPDSTKCMRTIVNFDSDFGPPSLAVDTVHIDRHSDFSDCVPQALADVRQHV